MASPTRDDLLNLVEKTYGTRHPDFSSIRTQYRRITEQCHDQEIESDARLLIAGLDATQNAYEDWEEMNRHEKTQALSALRRIRTLTRSTLHKCGVTVD